MEKSSSRYHVSPIHMTDMVLYPVFDQTEQRYMAACEFLSDGELIAAALNTLANLQAVGPAATRDMNPRLRPLMATELADWRMKLEHENGGPLIGDPQLAFFLDDLCTFFGFNTGERALALGPSLLVFLNNLEAEEQPVPELSELLVI